MVNKSGHNSVRLSFARNSNIQDYLAGNDTLSKMRTMENDASVSIAANFDKSQNYNLRSAR